MTNKTCSPSVFFKCTYIRSFVVFRITLIVCHYPWFVWKQENYLTSPLDSLGCLTGPCLKHSAPGLHSKISHTIGCIFFSRPGVFSFSVRIASNFENVCTFKHLAPKFRNKQRTHLIVPCFFVFIGILYLGLLFLLGRVRWGDRRAHGNGVRSVNSQVFQSPCLWGMFDHPVLGEFFHLAF